MTPLITRLRSVLARAPALDRPVIEAAIAEIERLQRDLDYAVALRLAISAPEPEPVARVDGPHTLRWSCLPATAIWMIEHQAPLYASSPARTPMTDASIVRMRDNMLAKHGEPLSCVDFARAVERWHGIGVE